MTPLPVRYGAGAIATLPQVVHELGGSRVLLVCGRRSFEASGAVRVLAPLQRAARVRRWSEFAPNPDVQDLTAGLEVVRAFRPDVIVGVGGGSAMDLAKLLAVYAGADPAGVPGAIAAGGAIGTRTTRLALAPTTSGSGSEATHFAVVYSGPRKYSVAGPALRPDVVILDPALLAGCSPYQRATSGIDAVAQAIESIWAAGADGQSRRYATRALRLLLPAIEAFVSEPAAGSARAMLLGSHLAGRAIDISKTTGAHALSYGITKGYGVSHGHAVALTLGAFIDVHLRAAPSALQPSVTPRAHAEAMRLVLDALGESDPDRARPRFEHLAGRCGLPMRLADVGISTGQQVRDLAAAVNAERLANNPVRLDASEIETLLRSAR